MFICPICQSSLHLSERRYSCINRHSFDIAKEGYVNLLPVQHKNSKAPGDNPQMMQARRQFLDSGAYQPLSDQVNQLMGTLPVQRVLDLGCGEGYYTGRLEQCLSQLKKPQLNSRDLEITGIDIAKNAVRISAKRYPNIAFAVASAYQLPLEGGYFDAILRIYAPSLNTELQRVIKPAGYLLTVTPGPRHLIEMKQAVYQEVKLHQDAIKIEEGFSHQQRQQLSYELDTTAGQLLDQLLQMVPLAWKFTGDSRQQFVHNTPKVTIDFLIDVYQRNTLTS